MAMVEITRIKQMRKPKQQIQAHSIKIVERSAGSDNLRYVREKLGVAVWKLATGVDGIKARLADAYIEIAILQESDFPPELRSKWKQIRSDLTGGKMQYESIVRDGALVRVPVGLLYSTLRFMRINKAQEIAKQICELEAMMDSYVERDYN